MSRRGKKKLRKHNAKLGTHSANSGKMLGMKHGAKKGSKKRFHKGKAY